MLNERWFSGLYTSMYKKLYNHLYGLAKRIGRLDMSDQIDDCLHDTFLELWQKKDDVASHPNLEAWLMVTARNKFLNRINKHANRYSQQNHSLDDCDFGNGESTMNKISFDAYAGDRAIAQMLEDVSTQIDEQAYAFLLAYYDKNTTVRELAGQYDTSEGALKMRAKRLIKRMRETLRSIMLLFLLLTR